MMLADAYVHQIDPFIIRLNDSFGLRWYGMAYLAGLVIAWFVLRWMSRTGRCRLNQEQVTDFLFAVFAGVLVGGRLGYVIFYDPALLADFSDSFPFWGVLALTKGGMASHGGMIGVLVASWIYSRRINVPLLHLFDCVAIVAPAGLCLGRIANFINGELWGRPIPESMRDDAPSWSVRFPGAILQWGPDDLPRLETAAATIGVSPVEWRTDVAELRLQYPEGTWPGWAETLAHADRSEAAVRVHQTVAELVHLAYDPADAAHGVVLDALTPALQPRYPSQFIQALTDGPLLAGLLIIAWWGPRRPGLVSAWFLIGYGVMRMASERFREPDEGVSLLFDTLTRGQVLSAGMILVGAAMLAFVIRRNGERVGGIVSPVRASSGLSDNDGSTESG